MDNEIEYDDTIEFDIDYNYEYYEDMIWEDGW